MFNRYQFIFFIMVVFVGTEAHAGKEKGSVQPTDPSVQTQAEEADSSIDEPCPFSCGRKYHLTGDAEHDKKKKNQFMKHILVYHGMSTATPYHKGKQRIECPWRACEKKDLNPLSLSRHLNSHQVDSRILYEAHTKNCPICIINGASIAGADLRKGRRPSDDELRVKEFPTWVNHPIDCSCDQSFSGLKELFVHVSQVHYQQKKQMIEDHIKNCVTCIGNEVELNWFSFDVKKRSKQKKTTRPSDIAFSEEQQKELEPEHSMPKPAFRPVEVQTKVSTTVPQINPGFRVNVLDKDFEDISEAFDEYQPYLPLTEEERAMLNKHGYDPDSQK